MLVHIPQFIGLITFVLVAVINVVFIYGALRGGKFLGFNFNDETLSGKVYFNYTGINMHLVGYYRHLYGDCMV